MISCGVYLFSICLRRGRKKSIPMLLYPQLYAPARCYVLIDLKMDELTHQDLGQMQMYVNYYTRELMNPGDNPPVGIVLCAEKNDAVVKYTLPEGEQQIFAAKYMTYLPTEEEIKHLLCEDSAEYYYRR